MAMDPELRRNCWNFFFSLEGGVSWQSVLLIILNLVLGSGVLAWPNFYKHAGGEVNALILQVVVISFIEVGLLMIISCCHRSCANSYQAVVGAYTGRAGRVVSSVLIVAHEFGVCVTFLVLIADQLDHNIGPKTCHLWYLSRYFTLPVVSICTILPICFPKEMGSFDWISVGGILTVIYLAVMVIAKYFMHDEYHELIPNQKPHISMPNEANVLTAIATVLFSFQVHIESLPLYATMKNRTIPEFGKALSTCIVSSVLVYNLVGIFGYYQYGSEVKSDILSNYHNLDGLVRAGTIMIPLNAVMTYPVNFYCARLVLLDACDRVLGSRYGWSEVSQRVCLTLLLFVSTVAVALCISSLGDSIEIFAVTASLFIFVFPGVCYLQMYLYPQSVLEHAHRLLGALFIILGTCLAGTLFAKIIHKAVLLDHNSEGSRCS